MKCIYTLNVCSTCSNSSCRSVRPFCNASTAGIPNHNAGIIQMLAHINFYYASFLSPLNPIDPSYIVSQNTRSIIIGALNYDLFCEPVVLQIGCIPLVCILRLILCSDGCGTLYPQNVTSGLHVCMHVIARHKRKRSVHKKNSHVYTCILLHTYFFIMMQRSAFPRVWSSLLSTKVIHVVSSGSSNGTWGPIVHAIRSLQQMEHIVI